MKTLDDIYAGGVIEQDDGTLKCSVCDAVYKRESAAIKHFNKQSCHSPVDVFGGTDYETVALEFYKNILVSEGKTKARPTVASFRKSSLYKNCVTFIVSCMVNELDSGMLYSFLDEIVGFKFPNKILLEGQDPRTIKDFRAFIHNHPAVSDSKEYFNAYKDELLTDPDFLIESIEKAKISKGFIMERSSLLDAVDRLPLGYQIRLMDVIEYADQSKY